MNKPRHLNNPETTSQGRSHREDRQHSQPHRQDRSTGTSILAKHMPEIWRHCRCTQNTILNKLRQGMGASTKSHSYPPLSPEAKCQAGVPPTERGWAQYKTIKRARTTTLQVQKSKRLLLAGAELKHMAVCKSQKAYLVPIKHFLYFINSLKLNR